LDADASFCWTELSTPDRERAEKFYARLFGWESTPQAVRSRIGQSIDYALLALGGRRVGGLCPMSGGQRKQGAQPGWLSYVFVADADSVARKAKSLGASLLTGPLDVFDLGRLSILRDPQGALFGTWQPIRLGSGFQTRGEPGFACWFEHVSPDVSGAARFYGELFGWSQDGSVEGGRIVLGQAGAGIAGLSSSSQYGGNLPCQWLTFFGVEDCVASTQKLESLKGKVVVPAVGAGESVSFAVARDPAGAAFGLMSTLERR
jgi:uncharacterized protein